ncbi:MAG: hypothetical protein ACSHX0_03390 [Akkermansiaceae bacterium]
MFISRKKKQLRDHEAGLVFNWRGVQGYKLGKFLALLMTLLVFAFMLYSVKVEGVMPAMSSVREVSVTMIDETDPMSRNLMMLVEERSPFLPRWDPAYDSDVYSRIDQGVERLIAKKKIYNSELLSLPQALKTEDAPSLITLDEGFSIDKVYDWGVRDTLISPNSPYHVELELRMKTGDRLADRVEQDSYILPDGFVDADVFGQSFVFLVGIDDSGEVVSCFPALGGSLDLFKPSDTHKLLAGWLRQQTFKPLENTSEGGTWVGHVELQIFVQRN